MPTVAQSDASGASVAASHLFPRPYRAMLAICSDLDETPDAQTYIEQMRFLNTAEETSMGPGVGLEIGNTMYFDMAPDSLSYWNTTEEYREKFRALIRSGHIDCLHSFGDLATTRAHAARALEELQKHDCFIPVWVDHAQAATNFGADIMQGHGDEPGHPAYHADLTAAYGIEYFWRGRVTSVIGQDRAVSLRGIADWSHPLDSAKTLAKEAAKQILAHVGSPKYAIHARNRILIDEKLRDGRPIKEFLRANPHWSGVSGTDTGTGIASVLSKTFLDRLVERQAPSIIYTHLGKLPPGGSPRPFPAETVAAFRRLAEYHHSGKICVTTTARLLQHCANVAQGRPASSWTKLKFPDLR